MNNQTETSYDEMGNVEDSDINKGVGTGMVFVVIMVVLMALAIAYNFFHPNK